MTPRTTRLSPHSIVFGTFALLAVLSESAVRADPLLYTITDLGPANPSAAYLSGQSQLDPSGNYLGALSPGQQAAFQAGSFDVYAHPATSAPSATFFMESGGDIVHTNDLSEPVEVSPHLTTSNNLGQSAGVGSEINSATNGDSNQLVMFTSNHHSITYTAPTQPFWETTTVQSPGYLSVLWANNTLSTGQYLGTVAGINDHGNLALTENTYTGPAYTLVQTPYLYGPAGTVSLGSLGGTNGVANALNNANEVVGWSQIAGGTEHAFVYANETMQDLNLLIPPLSGITLVSAVGIDSAGEIAAYGTNSSGQMDEYFLTPAEVPAPEPGTLAVMSLVVLALAARHAQVNRREAR